LKTIILLVSILAAVNLFASESEWEGAILKKMLESMSKSAVISVYTKDKTLQKEFQNSYAFHMVQDCKKSDFVLVRKSEDLNQTCNKPTIVFDYYTYLQTPNAVGVFFWQKGRPTIRFSQKRLQSFDLKVHGELLKFVSTKK